MTRPNQPNPENNFNGEQAERLLYSFHRHTGKHLIDPAIEGDARYKALHDLPYGVLSHNAEADPVLNYSNAAGLAQFEISWEQLIEMPSRFTAEEPTQEERNRLLKQVHEHGYINDYQGVRISAKGQRFFVEEAIVWNIIDESDCYWGQAAILYKCRPI